MAVNFKITIQRRNGRLHMKLKGDFDGTSAHQLLDHLRKHRMKCSTIFVHTDSLENLIPFGVEVFKNNVNDLKKHMHLVFTGEKASRFSS